MLQRQHERPRRRLRQRDAVERLRRRQPAVLAHRRVGDVGQHRVGAAEGHQRGDAEEQVELTRQRERLAHELAELLDRIAGIEERWLELSDLLP